MAVSCCLGICGDGLMVQNICLACGHVSCYDRKGVKPCRVVGCPCPGCTEDKTRRIGGKTVSTTTAPRPTSVTKAEQPKAARRQERQRRAS